MLMTIWATLSAESNPANKDRILLLLNGFTIKVKVRLACCQELFMVILMLFRMIMMIC